MNKYNLTTKILKLNETNIVVRCFLNTSTLYGCSTQNSYKEIFYLSSYVYLEKIKNKNK